jgi:hypothetical protein
MRITDEHVVLEAGNERHRGKLRLDSKSISPGFRKSVLGTRLQLNVTDSKLRSQKLDWPSASLNRDVNPYVTADGAPLTSPRAL